MFILSKRSKYGKTYFSLFIFPHFGSDIKEAKKFDTKFDAKKCNDTNRLDCKIEPIK